MNTLLKFAQKISLPTALLLAMGANAQNPVQSTHVDEKYAYTTVVYKNTAASDKDVLTALESNFGIGDVVRVTLAPPPAPVSAVAASEPVYANKTKGEDTWLPETKGPEANLSASTFTIVSTPIVPAANLGSSAKPLSPPLKNASPKGISTTKAVKPAENAPAAVVQIQHEPAGINGTSNLAAKGETKVSAKSVRAHKSVKKSGKKSTGTKMKLKNRKAGKQRYACPKF